MSLPTISGLTTSVYGTNSSNAVGYNIAEVASTDLMRENKLIEIANNAVSERTRRGQSAIQIPGGYFSGRIYGSRVQDIINVVQVAGPAATQAYNGAGQGTNSSDGRGPIIGYTPGRFRLPIYGPLVQPEVVTYPQTAAPSFGVSFSKGDQISSLNINTLIRTINNAGAACTCNCNYCTCNCNYCTCNCNYACTCNCNYSDEQVKTNIEYI